jgi:altronate hydrolase/galactarate dehydratase
VGTRNYLGVITSVNCSGSVARFIAEACEREPWLRDNPAIDGVVPIVHGTGCGMSGKDEGYETLFRTIQGYARNPNFAGILLVGLGCEVMQVPDLIGKGRMRGDGAFRYMTIQQTGGTRRTVEKGVSILREMAETAARAVREPVGLEHLVVGMQCGGSDGYSGITANPALGAASDLLVGHGGTTILSETPEIYGASTSYPSRRQPRGGREDRGADQVVGGLHLPLGRRDGQQPLPRQQEGRPDDHP